MGTIKAINVLLSCKGSLFPQTPSANFPLRSFAKIWVLEHRAFAEPFTPLRVPPSFKYPFAPLSICKNLREMGTCGTPLGHLRYIFPPNVQVLICHGGHMQTFGEMDTGHLGYPFRELGVAYPFPPNVYFPQVPICPGAHFSRYPFAQILSFSTANLRQVPIYFDAHLPRVLFCHLPGAHVPRCSFASSAHLPQVSVYANVSKCPFALVPIISSNPHLSRCAFPPNAHLPQVPKFPGLKCLRPSICPKPILSNSLPCSLTNGFLRFYSRLFSVSSAILSSHWFIPLNELYVLHSDVTKAFSVFGKKKF